MTIYVTREQLRMIKRHAVAQGQRPAAVCRSIILTAEKEGMPAMPASCRPSMRIRLPVRGW